MCSTCNWSPTKFMLMPLLSAPITSAVYVLSASHRRDIEAHSKSIPKWMDPRIFVGIDLALAIPSCYAFGRIIKNGGGFQNTDTLNAFGCCALNMLACLASYFNSKKIKPYENFVYGNIWTSAMCTAWAFHIVDKVAGICLGPYAVWSGFYYMFASYLASNEEKEA